MNTKKSYEILISIDKKLCNFVERMRSKLETSETVDVMKKQKSYKRKNIMCDP